MKNLLISMVCWYQKNISLWFTSKNIHCKFYPTCSEYMKQALEKYGVFKGLLLGIWRIIRCNPLKTPYFSSACFIYSEQYGPLK